MKEGPRSERSAESVLLSALSFFLAVDLDFDLSNPGSIHESGGLTIRPEQVHPRHRGLHLDDVVDFREGITGERDEQPMRPGVEVHMARTAEPLDEHDAAGERRHAS